MTRKTLPFSLLLSALLSFFAAFDLCGQSRERSQYVSDSTIGRLKREISNVLAETGAPAAGIALVHRSGRILVEGFGKADMEHDVDAGAATVFRCASVSKMVTALCILELVNERKLRLEDRLFDIAPEVEFKNTWEKSDPVRIIHLLNHTTGWDDIHSPEIAHNSPTPIALSDALNFHPHSRICRWVPGTRKAYSNSGYGVAAYVVEKVSGLSFEDFARAKVLTPLKMEKTTFLNDALFREHAAVQYDRNVRAIPYRHVLYRAAGAMNSTPQDMANLVEFLIGRGTFRNDTLLPEHLINTMELPRGTPGARAGVALGYGLGNETTVYNGFVYNGHSGSLDGGLCEVAYLPTCGTGHVIFINATNPAAFQRLSKLLRDFEAKLCVQDRFADVTPLETFTFENGYYVPINPRNQGLLFMDYLVGIEQIEREGNSVVRSWIFDPAKKQKYTAISDSTFLLAGTGKIAMAKTSDPLAGDVLYFDNLVMKKISGIIVAVQLLVAVLWGISCLVAIMVWMFCRFLSFFNPGAYSAVFRLYNFPALTAALYLALVIMLRLSLADYDNQIARPTVMSVIIALLSILIVLAVLMSVISLYRNRNVSKSRLVVPIFLALMHLLVTGYLVFFNVIPVITWA
jgi:CubicO group peptidase (beta-lactamase class C family)